MRDAPMALRTYEEARPWARAIREEVLERKMPPWQAGPGYGHFANDISLNVREKEIILSWADGGAPSGVLKAEESIPPVFVPPVPEWSEGEPDQVFTIGSGAGIAAPRFARLITSAIAEKCVDDIAKLRPLLLLSMIALGAGLFFKVSAVPFHLWAPDVYEGAPTSVTAFLSTGSKAASFALYARIFSEALGPMRADWAPLLGLVAAITIMVGNWAAVTQENSKRLLAYSSISNAGYLLLGLVANNLYGYIGLIVYLVVYTLMNMGAFGIMFPAIENRQQALDARRRRAAWAWAGRPFHGRHPAASHAGAAGDAARAD